MKSKYFLFGIAVLLSIAALSFYTLKIDGAYVWGSNGKTELIINPKQSITVRCMYRSPVRIIVLGDAEIIDKGGK